MREFQWPVSLIIEVALSSMDVLYAYTCVHMLD